MRHALESRDTGRGGSGGSRPGEAGIRVRQADGYDIDELVSLETTGLTGAGSRKKPDRERLAKGMSIMCAGGEERLALVAEKHGHLVGMVLAQLIVSGWEGGIVALADSLNVKPGPDAEITSERLLNEVRVWAHQLGAVSSYLVEGPLPGAKLRKL